MSKKLKQKKTMNPINHTELLQDKSSKTNTNIQTNKQINIQKKCLVLINLIIRMWTDISQKKKPMHVKLRKNGKEVK